MALHAVAQTGCGVESRRGVRCLTCLVSALISMALLHDARHAELDASKLGHNRVAKWTGMNVPVVGM